MTLKRFALLLCLLFAALPAAAQDPPTEQGIWPLQSYEGTDIDSINLATGILVLHVPLISYPQRGGVLKLDFDINYSSPSLTQFHDPDNGPWSWSFPAYSNVISISPKGVPATGFNRVTTGPNEYTVTASIQDPDGVTHKLGWTNITGTQLRSLDGSGYLVNFDSSGNHTTVDRNGVTWSNSTATDPNGNEILGFLTPMLTDTLGRNIPAAAAPTWNPPGLNGGYTTFQLSAINVQPQTLTLPNNTSYTFTFTNITLALLYRQTTAQSFPVLTSINLPTGGTITYTYPSAPLLSTCLVGGEGGDYWFPVLTRTVNANDGTGPHKWTYAYNQSTSVTTVTDPLGNISMHTFQGPCSPAETITQDYDNAGNLLRTVNRGYSSTFPATGVLPNLTSVTTVWPNGQQKKVSYTYDIDNGQSFQFGLLNTEIGVTLDGASGYTRNPFTVVSTDYGTGTPTVLQTTTNSFEAFTKPAYLTNNFLDLPASVKVAGGTQTAYTTYMYDEGSVVPSGIGMSEQHVTPPGTVRGNQTSVHRQLNNGSTVAVGSCPAVGSGGYLVTNVTFFDTGVANVSKDPCLNDTTYAYSGAYYGAYVTGITNALGQSTTRAYDLNTGLITATSDLNTRTTYFGYDSMWRLASMNHPDGGSTTIAHQESSPPYSETVTKKLTSAQNLVTTTFFDGAGRPYQTELLDPQGPVYTDTTYDAAGRVSTVSNPYRTKSDSTYGVTTYSYDALGRTLKIIPPDGTPLSNNISTQYCGNSTLTTDQAGHWRRTKTDGLGRLTEVDEPNSLTATVNVCPGTGEPIWPTTYGYDALNNLTGVAQGGSRNRSSNFDSLQRLTSSLSPETGSTPFTYTYDASGNVYTKTDPRGIAITYSYDALNRLLGKSYSNSEQAISYSYDQSSCQGPSPCYNVGHRTVMIEGANAQSWSYDAMGRVTGQHRHTNGIELNASWAYDMNGDLASVTYPSGRTVSYTWDSAGRPSVATDVANGIDYIQGSCANGLASNGVCYAPQGSIASANIGTPGAASVFMAASFNTRLQPNVIQYSNQGINLWGLQYSFVDANNHNNGNVASITNLLDGTRSQQFTYDQVNRVLTAETTTGYPANFRCWGESYTYDEWGNLTAIGVASPAYNGCTQDSLSVVANSSNRLSSLSYDGAGNVLNDGTHAYVWTAEGRVKSAAGLGYTYDGDGNRVQKAGGPIYWYGSQSEVLDESDLSGNIDSEYVYFGGRRLAWRDTFGNISYYLADALGSTRGMVSSQGILCYDADFTPWGAQRVAGNNTCPQNVSQYLFTGKERDSESGLDNFGARYSSSIIGRFLSPDPGSVSGYAHLDDPQSWNGYSYARGNPLNLNDPTGTIFCRSPNGTPEEQGLALVCDLSDQQYLNSSPDQQAAYDKLGYTHYDSSDDTGADHDAWQNKNGNTSADFVGYGLVFALSYAGFEGLFSPFGSSSDRQRLPQDENVNPNPPSANNGPGYIGTSPGQRAALDKDLADAKANGATDIRVNQQQVNGAGERVGINMPDLQYTDKEGVRQYIEYERSVDGRGAAHEERILANDPAGVVTIKIVP
jgi:RHS repeat-associated protein